VAFQAYAADPAVDAVERDLVRKSGPLTVTIMSKKLALRSTRVRKSTTVRVPVLAVEARCLERERRNAHPVTTTPLMPGG